MHLGEIKTRYVLNYIIFIFIKTIFILIKKFWESRLLYQCSAGLQNSKNKKKIFNRNKSRPTVYISSMIKKNSSYLGEASMFCNTRLDSDFNETYAHISSIIAQSR